MLRCWQLKLLPSMFLLKCIKTWRAKLFLSEGLQVPSIFLGIILKTPKYHSYTFVLKKIPSKFLFRTLKILKVKH